MGQNVTVVAKKSSNPKVLRFEINRSLTGMGHERYESLADVVRDRPVDELARRLLSRGGIDYVHVNSSVITVCLSGGSTGEGLADVIANLFRFYGDEPEVVAGDADAADDADVHGPDTDVVEPEAAVAPETAADDATRADATPQDADDAPAPVDNEPQPEASTDHFPDDADGADAADDEQPVTSSTTDGEPSGTS